MAFLAPAIGFAQSNSFVQTYCTTVNSYTQYCEWFEGQSALSINSTGQITTNAGTEVNWAFIINTNQCEDNTDGNPYACQPPTYPAPTVSVGTTISPLGTSGSASSGCGWGCAQLALTAQASQAGTYTETSNHSAYFPPSGDNLAGQTQQQQSYTPPQPTITSVSPSTWDTGTSTSVTISGSNFGSSPTVSLSGDNYATWSQGTASADGTTITGTATVSPSDPGGETVDITVAAGGSGNGFLGGEQQGAQSQPAMATVVATVQFAILGKSFIFVGTDPQVIISNTYTADATPSGGTLSATSSDSSDTVQIVPGPPPAAQFTTAHQSQSNSDRTLKFTYTSGNQSKSQTMNVTARQFAYAANNSPTNVCTLGYGTNQTYVYTVYTHPDKQAVDSGSGLNGTAVTESFSQQPQCGQRLADGALNANGEFQDWLSYCQSTPLMCSQPATTQTFSVGGFQVRTNTLVWGSSGISYTSNGPTQ